MRRRDLAPRLIGGILGVIAATAACAALGRAAISTARGQRLDQLVLSAAQNDTGPLSRVVFPVLNTVTVPVIVIALVIACVVALLQRRTSMALHIGVLVAGSALTTQVLKHLILTRAVLAPGIEITPNSFPSGHTTIAAAVAVALALASPRPARGTVAVLGAAWTAVAGLGTIAGGWHRPSDVLGALLVVAAWTSLVLALDAGRALARRRPPAAPAPAPDRIPSPGVPPTTRAPLAARALPALGVLALGAGAIALVQIPIPLELTDSSAQALAYAGTALVVGGCSALLLGWTLLLQLPARLRLPRTPGRGQPASVSGPRASGGGSSPAASGPSGPARGADDACTVMPVEPDVPQRTGKDV